MKQTLLVFAMLLTFTASIFSQTGKVGPGVVSNSTKMVVTQPISSRTYHAPAIISSDEIQDGRSSRNIVVPGKGNDGNDPLLQNNKSNVKIKGRATSLVFDANSGSNPSDPAGAVGPNHYFQVFNTGFRIFDKSGNPLTGMLAPSNIFGNDACCDLTVSYDNAADRWVVSQLYFSGTVEVAVSQTNDPVNTAWNVYSFSNIQDYQKVSVWSDGYYMTANKDSGTASTSNVVFALERDAMLAGNASAQIIGFPLPGISTSGFYSPQAFNVTNNNMPATGSMPVVYLQDDAWAGVTSDHVKLWEVDVDWATPANSSISATPLTLTTAPFVSVFDGGSFSNLTQPNGQDIDALQATIMNQAQFRKFADHNSAVFNFVVDVVAGTGEQAAIRWMELRQSGDGQPWSLYQEGTYTAPNNKHAWCASMAMDSQGNIGMGYTGMGGTSGKHIGAYYTGRYANDPLGSMTIAEEIIAEGDADHTGNRYGDYSKIDVDPTNDKAFWFTTEYRNVGLKDVVGVFQIAPNFNTDAGVVAIVNPVSSTLGAAESVTITIFNYGQNDISNFDVTYQIDSGAVVTETYTGTIASSTTANFTFATTADLSTLGNTYTIVASTVLTGDEDNTNDSYSVDVTNLTPDDIGVTSIDTPVSGTGLTASESITVTITNFGGVEQSNFDVSYTLNGNTVTEAVAGPLAANSTMSYVFTQTGDFSAIGNYDLSATTSLAGDADTSNDSTSVVVTKSTCQPSQNCSFGDGLTLFQFGTIDNASACEGYGDFTSMSTMLTLGATYTATFTTGYGNQYVSIWVDFNDDFVFDTSEYILQDFVLGAGSGSGTYTESTDITIPTGVNTGEHLMRVKTNWNAGVPDDACEVTSYGETEDYIAHIVPTAAVSDLTNEQTNLDINYLDNNQFNISLQSAKDYNNVTITVYDTLGKRLVYHKLINEGNTYNYSLDMSYVAKGVYLVRVGNNEFGKVERIIVK